ncbi:MAG: CHASE domain-containing protein [Rubrobacter sp.]|nr:CHASE domain-containing protein [Rubrobacter sp.]
MIPDENQRKATRSVDGGKDARAHRDPADEDGRTDGAWRVTRYHLQRAAIPGGVLVISLFLTILAWQYVRESVEVREGVRFNETVRAVQGAIDRRTNAGLDAMYGARSFFYASDFVERGEWSSYVEDLDPEVRFVGLQALGYAERVTPEEKEAYSRRTKQAGLPALSPDGERPVYFPVASVAPSGPANQKVLSHDWYSEPAHRAAINRARDTGAPQATGTINVFTDAAPGSNATLRLRDGYAVYLPIYREGAPTGTVTGRRKALEGFVFGLFRAKDLLGGAFEEPTPTVDFEVYDGATLAPSKLIYDNDDVERAGEEDAGQFSDTRHVKVAGRTWSLYFVGLEEFEELEGGVRLTFFVLFTGVGVSLLLFGITAMLVRSRILAERAGRKFEDANRDLQAINQELEAFSYSVSHDLRAPLRSMDGFSQILLEDYRDELDEEGQDYLGRVRAASQRMGQLIDDLLELSRVTRGPLRRTSVNLSAIATDVAGVLKASDPGRRTRFVISEDLVARGDARLLRVALDNLLGNAWKFTSKEPEASVEFGASRRGGTQVYYVQDNGAGFDAAYAGKLFGAFQRLHGSDEFEGTGVGLATVARVIRRHGGEIWAEGKVGEGAAFYFTLEGGFRPDASRPEGEPPGEGR